MKIIAIIPCRYSSKRFPGKALASINGYPMMWHVYNQATKSRFVSKVIIATDDKRIKKKCGEFDLNCMMTKKNHLNGTERIAECAKKITADIYVNVQGDEPMINPESIDLVIEKLININNPNTLATNAFHLIKDRKDIEDHNVVKTIFDKNYNVLAYSRNPIPYSKNKNFKYFRQIGLYAFTRKGILLFGKMKSGQIEKNETIEMYRIIENSFTVKMVRVKSATKSVDTIKDLKEVRRLIK